MEIVLLLFISVMIIVIFNKLGKDGLETKENINSLHHKINQISKELSEKSFPKVEDSNVIEVKNEEIPKPIIPIQREKVPELKIEEVFKVTEEKPIEVLASISTPTLAPKPKPVYVPQKSWLETFKEKNPDLEKFIGENLINKVGILILVLGISFFVKYAIDKDWINEPARVGIGILAGGLVMGIAHKLKKNFGAFSSVLVAGAISIFYFTIAIAFHEYQLFSQTVAFSIMVVITAFSTLVSVSYNRQELAVLSLIGGFAVPFMVSTGQGNYIVLFTYIAILNIGILVISYYKKWKIATIIAFVFTGLLFSSWYVKELLDNKLPHLGALLFATLFYFIFSIVVVLNNIRNKGVFSVIEYFILVANTFIFFGLGLGIIHNWGIDFKGVFTLLLALYNLAYAMILYRKFGLDKNAIYLLLGLALTFITLTIPIQFKGNQITMFWAVEAVLLFWLSQKSKINSFKLGAIIVQILAVISLIMDWHLNYNLYSETKLSIVFNSVFITGIIIVASFLLTYFLLKKEVDKSTIFSFDFNPKLYKTMVLFAIVIIFYFVGMFEINYQATQFFKNYYSAFSFPLAYHFLFSGVVVYFGLKQKSDLIHRIATLITLVNVTVYVILYYAIPSKEIVENIYSNSNSNSAFYFHYLIFGTLVYFVFIIAKQIKGEAIFNFMHSKFAIWVLVFCSVYILSNELMVHSLFFSNKNEIVASVNQKMQQENFQDVDSYYSKIFYDDEISRIKRQVIKIGYPILWGVLSFVILIIGIKRNWKQMRIIALSLLGLTIVKLFVYDINNVSETGKIIAFILLGILILIISFVYQKIKKLVVDNTPKANDDEN